MTEHEKRSDGFAWTTPMSVIIAFLPMLLLACESSTPKPSATQSHGSDVEQPPPVDFSVRILEEDKIPGVKHSLSVLLNRKATEAELRAMALKLQARDPASYERTFITYLLPGWDPHAGAWATTHFDPDLKVRILGLTKKEEELLRKLPSRKDGSTEGVWLEDRTLVGKRITIVKSADGRYHELWAVVENDEVDEGEFRELVRRRTPKGVRFEEKGGNDFGEYYLVDAKTGSLQFWSKDGLFYTAPKLD